MQKRPLYFRHQVNRLSALQARFSLCFQVLWLHVSSWGAPQKGEGQLRRLISLTSFQLKGNGRYATDYKDKKEKKKKKADKGEEKADKKSEKAGTA